MMMMMNFRVLPASISSASFLTLPSRDCAFTMKLITSIFSHSLFCCFYSMQEQFNSVRSSLHFLLEIWEINHTRRATSTSSSYHHWEIV